MKTFKDNSVEYERRALKAKQHKELLEMLSEINKTLMAICEKQ